MQNERKLAWYGIGLLFVWQFNCTYSVILPAYAYGDFLQSENYGRMIFIGDVMLARHVEHLQSIYGEQYPWEGIQFSGFDNPAIVANFEASIPAVHSKTPAGSVSFSVPSTVLPGIKTAGVTHVSLANNHSDDFGQAGYQHTKEQIEKIEIEAFGQPQEYTEFDYSLVQIGAHTVALFGLHLLEADVDRTGIKNFVTELSSDSDLQVAYVHWGNEYEQMHSTKQREQAELLVRAGVDLIVGHHPHVVQDIEIIEDVPVFYSLGNYIFDQYFSPEVMFGLVLELQISDTQVQINLHPIESFTQASQPQLLSGEAKVGFLERLAKNSEATLFEAITAGVLISTLHQ